MIIWWCREFKTFVRYYPSVSPFLGNILRNSKSIAMECPIEAIKEIINEVIAVNLGPECPGET